MGRVARSINGWCPSPHKYYLNVWVFEAISVLDSGKLRYHFRFIDSRYQLELMRGYPKSQGQPHNDYQVPLVVLDVIILLDMNDKREYFGPWGWTGGRGICGD